MLRSKPSRKQRGEIVNASMKAKAKELLERLKKVTLDFFKEEIDIKNGTDIVEVYISTALNYASVSFLFMATGYDYTNQELEEAVNQFCKKFREAIEGNRAVINDFPSLFKAILNKSFNEDNDKKD
jgi:DNA-binding protein YbaB